MKKPKLPKRVCDLERNGAQCARPARWGYGRGQRHVICNKCYQGFEQETQDKYYRLLTSAQWKALDAQFKAITGTGPLQVRVKNYRGESVQVITSESNVITLGRPARMSHGPGVILHGALVDRWYAQRRPPEPEGQEL